MPLAVDTKRQLGTTTHTAADEQTAPACSSTTVPTCPATMLLVDVTGNTLTTTSTQLQPNCIRDDDETYSTESTSSRTQPQHEKRSTANYKLVFFFHTAFPPSATPQHFNISKHHD
jgi:hypothetical protein